MADSRDAVRRVQITFGNWNSVTADPVLRLFSDGIAARMQGGADKYGNGRYRYHFPSSGVGSKGVGVTVTACVERGRGRGGGGKREKKEILREVGIYLVD